MTIRYDGKVAIVTGAGQGLGRSHAIELAKRGASVVVNDLGGGVDGSGSSSEAAKNVVTEIESAGGAAIANGANVAKFEGSRPHDPPRDGTIHTGDAPGCPWSAKG